MLLQAIQDADFETYVKLTDSSITCFEPEAVSFPSHGEPGVKEHIIFRVLFCSAFCERFLVRVLFCSVFCKTFFFGVLFCVLENRTEQNNFTELVLFFFTPAVNYCVRHGPYIKIR